MPSTPGPRGQVARAKSAGAGDAEDPGRWLAPLVARAFFQPCKRCEGGAVANYFCLTHAHECCPMCLADHQGCKVLQIRRSSYHGACLPQPPGAPPARVPAGPAPRSGGGGDDPPLTLPPPAPADVVRIAEVSKLIDTSGVQTYTINSARVVFLRERPQSRQAKPKPNLKHAAGGVAGCMQCGRALQDSFLYCSIGCKVNATKTEKDGEHAIPYSLRLAGGSRMQELPNPITPPTFGSKRRPPGSADQKKPKKEKLSPPLHRRKNQPARSPVG